MTGTPVVEVLSEGQSADGSTQGGSVDAGDEALVIGAANGTHLDQVVQTSSQAGELIARSGVDGLPSTIVDADFPFGLSAAGGPGDIERVGAGAVDSQSSGLRAGDLDNADVVDSSCRSGTNGTVVMPNEDKLVGGVGGN